MKTVKTVKTVRNCKKLWKTVKNGGSGENEFQLWKAVKLFEKLWEQLENIEKTVRKSLWKTVKKVGEMLEKNSKKKTVGNGWKWGNRLKNIYSLNGEKW